jgi:phospholipid/cholesterol/gamma-HCH transport system substrate-binding protein
VITAIRKNAPNFLAIVGLAILAAGVAGYILANQRVRFPWESKTFTLKAEFSTAQAVTPGQGQTVRVSGVRIGDISAVKLVNGRGVVTMTVDPEFKGLIHIDAHALLRPKTGLKDMFVELQPGSRSAPLAKPGWTIPVANTLPDVNPDEIYGALDADTRDYLHLLVDGAGQGLKGRGSDLREVLARFEPTHRDLARFATQVASRRENLRRLIHNLNVLNAELASKGPQLTELVGQASRVFHSFADAQSGISRAVGDLPGALRQTTDTLGRVQRFADVLRPATNDLIPAAHAIDRANHATRPFAIEATPIIRTQIRPFIRAARPLVRNLRPAAADLATATPYLTRTITVINHFFNLLGYNQNGREDPSNAARNEGYLYWLAWAGHNGINLFSTADANGNFRPIALNGTCTTLKATVDSNAQTLGIPNPDVVGLIQGLTGVLTDPAVCGNK